MTTRRRLRIYDLVGSQVVEAGGRKFGRVMDVELDPADGFAVICLELGRYGWLDRLGILQVVNRRLRGDHHRPLTVPWSSVDTFEDGEVRLRPGAPPPSDQGPEVDEERETDP